MTAISTVLAVVMLPLNLYIYTPAVFKNENQVDMVEILDFGALMTSLIVVFTAIGLGIFASEKVDNHNFHIFANRVSVISLHTIFHCMHSPCPGIAFLPCISMSYFPIVWVLCRNCTRAPLRHCLQHRRRCSNLETRCQVLLWSCNAMCCCPNPIQHNDHLRWFEEARTCHVMYRMLLSELWHCHLGCTIHVSGMLALYSFIFSVIFLHIKHWLSLSMHI